MVKDRKLLSLSLCFVFKAKSIGFSDGLNVACKNENLRMIPKLWPTSGKMVGITDQIGEG